MVEFENILVWQYPVLGKITEFDDHFHTVVQSICYTFKRQGSAHAMSSLYNLSRNVPCIPAPAASMWQTLSKKSLRLLSELTSSSTLNL